MSSQLPVTQSPERKEGCCEECIYPQPRGRKNREVDGWRKKGGWDEGTQRVHREERWRREKESERKTRKKCRELKRGQKDGKGR